MIIKRKRNRIIPAMVLPAVLLLVSCGGTSGQRGTVQSSSAASEQTAVLPDGADQSAGRVSAGSPDGPWPGDEERIVLKLASTLSPEMGALSALSDFTEEVYAMTGGRIDIQIYPSSQLGDQVDYMRGVKEGTVEMCLVSTAALESLDPRFVIFGMPGLFTTPDKVNRFYESDICRELLDGFRQRTGIRSLALFHDGIRNVWLKDARAYRAEDFAGLRLRIPSEVEIRRKEFEALGAECVPMPLSECGVALQSGYIDGLENNVETIMNSDIAQQIRYQVKTEHAYSTLLLLINDSALMQIGETDRNILTDCARKYSELAFRDHLEGQEEAYAAAEKAGIVTIDPEPEDKKRIRDLMLDATKKLLEGLFPEGFYETVRAL